VSKGNSSPRVFEWVTRICPTQWGREVSNRCPAVLGIPRYCVGGEGIVLEYTVNVFLLGVRISSVLKMYICTVVKRFRS